MPELGAIDGVVLGAGARPLAEATIIVVSGPTHPDLASLSAADGSFSVEGLPPGSYVLRVAAEGLEPVEREVQVRAGERSRADVTLGREPAGGSS